MIDIALRVLSMEQAPRTSDGGEAIRRLSELRVLPAEFARGLAPIAGFRDILVHEYLEVDWALVYAHFAKIGDLRAFAGHVRAWLRAREAAG